MRQQPRLWPETEREKKKRENYPAKSPNLRHCWPRSQHKGLSKYQRRASWLRAGPSPARHSGQAGASQSRKGANSAPERASPTKLRTGFQFLTKDFLRFWTVDIHWRVAARDQQPRRHTRHTRDGRAQKPRLVPGYGTKCRPNRVCAFVEYQRT